MDRFNRPDVIWDNEEKVCRAVENGVVPLPNYEGLCVFVSNRQPMVMNTWLEDGVRKWDLVCMGAVIPNAVLDNFMKKAS